MTNTQIVVCSHCYKEHGLEPEDRNASHGICLRHAAQFLEESGLSPEKIQRAKAKLVGGAPDLGPVPQLA